MQVVFEQDRHEDVLNQCVVQFEPDSAEFKNVSFFVLLTYKCISKPRVDDMLCQCMKIFLFVEERSGYITYFLQTVVAIAVVGLTNNSNMVFCD